MKIAKILNNNYKLLSDNNPAKSFSGIYSTDLLSAAIKSAEIDNILITIINNSNVIACAVMTDLSGVIITECESVSNNIIELALKNDIVLIITRLKSYEVIIDLKERGLI